MHIQQRVDFLQLLMDAHQSGGLDAADDKNKVSAMDSTVETADEYKNWKDVGKKGEWCLLLFSFQ